MANHTKVVDGRVWRAPEVNVSQIIVADNVAANIARSGERSCNACISEAFVVSLLVDPVDNLTTVFTVQEPLSALPDDVAFRGVWNVYALHIVWSLGFESLPELI